MSQHEFDFDKAVRAREHAIDTVEEGAADDVKGALYRAVVATSTVLEEFTTDDVWERVPNYVEVREPRVMGAVMRKAVKDGVVERTGRVAGSRMGLLPLSAEDDLEASTVSKVQGTVCLSPDQALRKGRIARVLRSEDVLWVYGCVGAAFTREADRAEANRRYVEDLEHFAAEIIHGDVKPVSVKPDYTSVRESGGAQRRVMISCELFCPHCGGEIASPEEDG